LEYKHKSVLLNESIDFLRPEKGGIFVDGTLGGGGHAEEILRRMPFGKLIGLDRDMDALTAASDRLKGYGDAFIAVHDNFKNIPAVLPELGIDGIDGCILDLGVSSYQLDNPDRGFSYHHNGPLDMRMDTTELLSAFKVVNEYSEWELYRVIKDYGEEKWASRIASFIVREREKSPIATTQQLVDVIKAAVPAKARRTGAHPARKTFQAIRIEVNGELAHLDKVIEGIIKVLKPGGRLCVISFHSLEDRIVKKTLKRLQDPCTCPPKAPQCVCGQKRSINILTNRPITPSREELRDNPRSESAKLRVAEKI